MSTAKEYTVIDLFCGAGGLSLGLTRAGFKPILAIDGNKSALQTYVQNLGDHVAQIDLSGIVCLPESTIIVGGPPCQGFSSAGMRQQNDQRNNLVYCFAQIVAKLRPTAFIFENVEGFLTAEGGDRVLDLLVPLVDAGLSYSSAKNKRSKLWCPSTSKESYRNWWFRLESIIPRPNAHCFRCTWCKAGS